MVNKKHHSEKEQHAWIYSHNFLSFSASSLTCLTWVNYFTSLLIVAVSVRVGQCVEGLLNYTISTEVWYYITVLILLLELLYLSKRSHMISIYSKNNMPISYEVILRLWFSDVESCKSGNYM